MSNQQQKPASFWVNENTYQVRPGRVEIYSGSMAYFDNASNSYRAIDTHLQQDENNYFVEKGVYHAYFAKDLTASCLITVQRGQASMCWTPRTLSYVDIAGLGIKTVNLFNPNTVMVVSGNQVTYQQIFGVGYDLRLTVETDELKEELLISEAAVNSLPTPESLGLIPARTYVGIISDYSTNLVLDGGNNNRSTNAPINMRLGGVFRFAISPVTAWDSQQNNSIHARNILMRNGVQKIGSAVPYNWLSSTVGAVTIDPSVTVQPPSKDNYMDKANPNTNRGTLTNLAVAACGAPGCAVDQDERPILTFSFNLTGVTINSGTLSMYYYLKGNDPVGRTYNVYSLQGAGATAWSETFSTWNNYDATHAWTTAGGDYSPTNSGSAVVPAAYGWMNWTLTSMIQSYTNNASSTVNLLVKDSDENPVQAYDSHFYSRDYAVDTTKRPKLVIDYTLPSLNVKSYAADGSTLCSSLTSRCYISITNASGTFQRQVSSGWANFTGQTGGSTVTVSARAYNTTSTNSNVKINSSNTVSITISGSAVKYAVLSIYQNTALSFKKADNTAFTPSAFSITFGNNGTTASAVSGGTFVNGSNTINSITWQGNNVKNSTTSFTVSSNAQSLAFKGNITRNTLIFKRVDGVAYTPTTVKLTAPNGTLLTVSSFSNVYMQNGSWTPSDIRWNSIFVRKNATAFTPSTDAKTWDFNTYVYSQAVGANTNLLAANATTITLISFNSATYGLSFTATCSPCQIYAGTWLEKPTSIVMDGVTHYEGNGWTWSQPNLLVSITGSTTYTSMWSGAHLGAGVQIYNQTQIWLGGINSNLTLVTDVIVDSYAQYNNYTWFNGTLNAPTWVIGAPFNYSSTLQATNITGVPSTNHNLNISTATILGGVKVWAVGNSGYLTSISDDGSNVLYLTYGVVGNTTIYSPSIPLAVIENSIYYTNTTGVWSYNSTSHILTLAVIYSPGTTVTIVFGHVIGTAHNVFIREEVFGAAFDSPGYYNLNVTLFYDTFRLTYTNQTNILVYGEPLILATVTDPAGTQYYRTLIPSASTQYMYIPDIRKYSITLFSIKVVDVPNKYKDAIIRISISGREVASGYLDVNYNFGVYLINGMYFTTTLIGSTSTYSAGGLNADPAVTTLTLTIPTISLISSTEIKSDILVWSASWVGSNLTVQFADANNHTSSAHLIIYELNSTGYFNSVYDNTFLNSASWSVVQAGNTSLNYYANLALVNSQFGSTTETKPFNVAYLGVTFPAISSNVLGLNDIFPVSGGWVYILSALLIISTSLIFSSQFGAVGGIVVAVVGIFMAAIGWLPYTAASIGYPAAALVLAVLSYISKRDRGE